jgi:3-hydroxyisobutyrate dehydrogenase-like beta-hydroxyacid dehydrogenase
MSTISIIGAGGMAAAIGGLAAKAGHTVEVMSRDAAKARALAEKVGAGATTGTFGTAPAGDIVILAVLYSAVFDVVKKYRATHWTCSSLGTTRRQKHASRRSSKASDCAQWIPGGYLLRGHWSTPAC